MNHAMDEDGRVRDHIATENGAGVARVTCGWKKPGLSLDDVRPYWRDVHSPAIARRDGIYEYRHYPLDPIRVDLFPQLASIDRGEAEEPGSQLMWLSDVRYADEAGMAAFSASPDRHVIAQILADIDLIVDQSTTYKVWGHDGWTFVDGIGAAPQGPVAAPTFALFFRQRGDAAVFRAALGALAERWARDEGVRRVRLALFEAPDMEAERLAGYPIKTHPVERQYQAWIDLAVADEETLSRLFAGEEDRLASIRAVHAYPVPAVYTFNYAGRPTLSGLRGYMAVQAIRGLDAEHQKDPGLLDWMYGEHARPVA